MQELWRNSAFCSAYSKPLQLYPDSTTGLRSFPWIWDAVIDETLSDLILIAIPYSACNFNVTAWKLLSTKFQPLGEPLGSGNLSDVLVSPDPDSSNSSFQAFHIKIWDDELMVGSVNCNLVARRTSAFSSAAMMYSCSMKKFVQVQWTSFSIAGQQESTAETITKHSVCRISSLSLRKQYKLSICTATNAVNRDETIEWLEYHKLIGVEHVFMYITALEEAKLSVIQSDLYAYIQQDYVTIIPWMYENCVRGMASGRSVGWIDPTNLQPQKEHPFSFFQPPPAIAQTAALASCYRRFKHTSRYMTHIDGDEFLVMGKRSPAGRATRRSAVHDSRNIVTRIDRIFKRHPKAPAISVLPIMMHNCPPSMVQPPLPPHDQDHAHTHLLLLSQNSKTLSISESESLYHAFPRLGTWNYATPGAVHEGKLILRTEAVEMFHIHYLTQLTEGCKLHHKYVAPYPQLALLHYKLPFSLSHSVYGELLDTTLTLPLRRYEQRCRHSTFLSLLPLNISVSSLGSAVTSSSHQMRVSSVASSSVGSSSKRKHSNHDSSLNRLATSGFMSVTMLHTLNCTCCNPN